MKKNLFMLALIASPQLIFAQAKGNYDYEKNANYRTDDNYGNPSNRASTAPLVIPSANFPNTDQMSFNIKGISNHKADEYVAIFSVTQMGKTASEANQLLQERINGFSTEIQKLGIKKDDIYIDVISFVPLYEYEMEKKIISRTYNEMPKGFETQQNIHIKFNDGNLVSKLVGAAALNEIYDIVKVEYFVKDQDKIKTELQAKCVAHLNEKLKIYEQMGVKVDTMFHTIAEASMTVYPAERYSSYAAFSSTSLETERGKINNVRKTRTQFYDKTPFNSFDVVLNPTILEPEVQFMYDLKVLYVVKKPQLPAPPAKKEYILLNPQGTTTTLKLD